MAKKFRVKSKSCLLGLPAFLRVGIMDAMINLGGSDIDSYHPSPHPGYSIFALGWHWRPEWLDVIEDTIVEDIDE